MRKKFFVFILFLISLFTFTGCSGGGGGLSKPKNYSVEVQYGSLTKTYEYEEGSYIDTYNFSMPTSLENNNYVVGYYYDSAYTTVFNGCRATNDLVVYAKLGTFKSLDQYTFCKDVDSTKLLNYFTTNGKHITVKNSMNMDMITALVYQSKGYGDEFYKVASYEVYSTMNRTREIYYFPAVDAFLITFSTTSKSAIGSLNYSYEYTGKVEFKIGDSLNEAIYTGVYNQACINSYTYNYEGKYTAGFVFTPSKVNPTTLRLADFATCTFTGGITDAMNLTVAQRNFDKNDSALKCYEKLNACFNLFDEVLKKIDSSYKSFK